MAIAEPLGPGQRIGTLGQQPLDHFVDLGVDQIAGKRQALTETEGRAVHLGDDRFSISAKAWWPRTMAENTRHAAAGSLSLCLPPGRI